MTMFVQIPLRIHCWQLKVQYYSNNDLFAPVYSRSVDSYYCVVSSFAVHSAVRSYGTDVQYCFQKC